MYYLKWNLPKSGDRYGVLRVEDKQFTINEKTLSWFPYQWTIHQHKATRFFAKEAKHWWEQLGNIDIEIRKD
jgi:hypothetical protein